MTHVIKLNECFNLPLRANTNRRVNSPLTATCTGDKSLSMALLLRGLVCRQA